MKNVLNIFLFSFLFAGAAYSCSDDSRKPSQAVERKLEAASSLEVFRTERENELLVKFRIPVYADVQQIELSYREAGQEDTEWETLFLEAGDYGGGGTYMLKVPRYAVYEVGIVLVGTGGVRSEKKSATAAPLSYEKADLLDCAHTLMTAVMEHYYHKSSRTCWQTWYPQKEGFWDGDALVWGQGSGLSAFVSMREATEGTDFEKVYAALDDDMFSGIQNFWVNDHGWSAYSVYPAAGNERFFDDNVWIGLDMADWYVLTGNARYLEQAKAVWKYLFGHGWDGTCGGGIHWKELNEPSRTKHTCSTAPAGVLSCKLYQITKEGAYMQRAVDCFDWLRKNMQDPADGLFYDNASPDPDAPQNIKEISKAKYSYNSGQPLQLACLLYKMTGDDSYLAEARRIAEACFNNTEWFRAFRSELLGKDIKVLAGHTWFNAVMCRGFFELYALDKNPKYVDEIRNSLLQAWFGDCRQENGLLNDSDLTGEASQSEWEILHQGALVELLARLSVWEKGKR